MAYIERTQTAGDRTKGTFSAWVKRGTLGLEQNLFVPYADSSNNTRIRFKGGDELQCSDKVGGSTIYDTINNNLYSNLYINRFLNIEIPYIYKNKLEEYNAIFGQQQIDNILSTIKIITHKDRKSEKIQQLKTTNIQKCIKWCEKNKILYNKNYPATNIFLGERVKKLIKKKYKKKSNKCLKISSHKISIFYI